MAKIWITYAWDDNTQGDVDFIAQELEKAGAEVKLDRWNIAAGERLWARIEQFITTKEESDAWIFIASQKSLSSEPCKEEYAYALDRALNKRGGDFPIIGLFLSSVDSSLIPAGIRTRLFVSITDNDWKERIIASSERRLHSVTKQQLEPYFLKIHPPTDTREFFAIEVRPRAGVWSPFFAAVPNAESEEVQLDIWPGPRNTPTWGGVKSNDREFDDGKFWIKTCGEEANPTRSFYIWCKQLPSILGFGEFERQPQFTVALNRHTTSVVTFVTN